MPDNNKISMNIASSIAARLVGQDEKSVTQSVSNPARNVEDWADTSEKMIAVTWQGKTKVVVCGQTVCETRYQVIHYYTTAETYKPKIIDDRDVIIKVTICGSDLHLYHGAVMQMQAGDIFGCVVFFHVLEP